MVALNRKQNDIDKSYITPHIKQLIKKKQALQRKYYKESIRFDKD